MAENEVTAVHNLQLLPELKMLNLDNNKLTEFPPDDVAIQSYSNLRTLKLRNNNLHFLMSSQFMPALERLYVDNNRLRTILGVKNLKNLHIVSMRSQNLSFHSTSTNSMGERSLVLSSDMPDCRALCLSANAFDSLSHFPHLLSLRTLELASAGVDTLPADFGQKLANLRTLNLNFNALKDLRPLLNIRNLERLYLAGNRLSRLRKNAAVLAKLDGLMDVDLRDNPFSIGFYPRGVDTRALTIHNFSSPNGFVDGGEDTEDVEQFTLPPADKEADAQYLARLDEDTKLRRRVYEMLLASSCGRLRTLDGMAFDKKSVMVKDKIWERLLALGVVRRRDKEENDDVVRFGEY